MASIFKIGGDEAGRNEPYVFDYRAANGKIKRKKGFTDFRLTEQLAAKLEDEVRLITSGLVDPEQELLAEHRTRPIEEQVTAFDEHLKRCKRSPKYRKQTLGRIRKVIAGAKITTLATLKLERVEEYLQELQEKENYGPKTINHYGQGMKGFCQVLVRNNRLAVNPLRGLRPLNAAVDVRHRRRALTAGERKKLINSARQSHKQVQGYDGELRARLYEIAGLTGLRRRELASLTPASFDLASPQPTLTVEAACSKHRRTDTLPLHPRLIAVLPAWLNGLKRTDRMFPGLETKKTWLMVKKDLERAGIEYETAAGIADFHASGRHTFITELLRNGATLAETRELARHGDFRMTALYTHIGLDDQAKALAALPDATTDEPASQCICSDSEPPAGHDASRPGTRGHQDRKDTAAANENTGKTSDPSRRKKSADGDRGHTSAESAFKWRRRESNPRPENAPRKLLRV